MKKILSLIAIMLGALVGYSQAPGILNYQGVARNSVGNVLVNKTINLRLTIRDGAVAGPTVYQESRVVTTNPFGLFNVQVGSPGATSVTGTIPGVNWAVGAKFIQVEIDPNGGTSFINIGTAQLASVPYSLYSNLAGDLVLPFNKTQADAGTLFRITNNGTGISGAIMGVTQSNAANAWGVHGRVDNTAAGGFSTGLLGTNLSTTGLGIGVTGSQNGSGWGVYGTTPSGIGVYGLSTSGTGVYGQSTSGVSVYGIQGGSGTNSAGYFQNSNAANTASTLVGTTNGTAGNHYAIRGEITSTSPGGFSAGVRGINNGTGGNGIGVWGSQAGSGWGVLGEAPNGVGVYGSAFGTGTGVRGYSDNGTGVQGFSNLNGRAAVFAIQTAGAAGNTNNVLTATTVGLGTVGFFENTNTANVANVITALTNGTGRAGSFNVNNTANGTQALDVLSNGAAGSRGIRSLHTGLGSPLELAIVNAASLNNVFSSTQTGLGRSGLVQITNAASTNNALEAFTSGTGWAGRFWSNNATPSALFTTGGVRMTGINEGLNRILTSDAIGNATWQNLAAIGGVTGSGTLNFVPKWTPSGTNLGNTLLFDNGASMGVGTTTPTHRFDVTHGGSTGIGINSTSGFSVLDINAASGDAAIRFGNAGVNQWNMRNNPGNDDLQFFELGGGGERMAIKNSTGNVAIGGSAGVYRLDILHGGSTGARIQSSSSFSVVDIDAASGDAALRFANAGVNLWNIRNQPGTDNLQIFELGGGGERMHIQNATGNISIGGEPSPVYKLDILHGGATGIRNRSSSTFSVIDIDAASGDAALRFVNAGVNQWNIRNQPGTDNLQIFELGGGGERMHIQNATGNVSIGGEPSPTYRLDVLHGGATGARIRSSATFSVVDIDANSGDAALRFANNGVNQWNTRNNPSTDDYQIFEIGGSERMRIENTTGTVVVSGDFTVVGVKAFTMDHPLDPANKLLRHAAAESNEVINFYSGNVVTDAAGKAVVQLPDYYEVLNKDSRYQLTVIGSFAQAIISKEVANNQFEIATNQPNVKVSWEVKGVRNDNHMKQQPFVAEVEKSAAQKGTFWDPAAHNQPMSKHVSNSSADDKQSSLNYTAPVPNKPVAVEKGGSLDYVVPASTNKKADISGSVLDVKPAEKKVDIKPADIKGTSIEHTTPAKPVEQKKTTGPDESTKTD